MIDQARQQAALTLYRQGCKLKEIARSLRVDVKTIRAIVRSDEVREPRRHAGAIDIEEVLLRELYARCEGYMQRMHEILTEEHGYKLGYSTLTRLLRDKGIGTQPDRRACHVPDVPGAEMQHDTSVHRILIGGTMQKIISSGLYLRYSKMRYIRFYRRFNRFIMKCFIDEALRFWAFCAQTCIIDNTNLAVWIGTGSSAVMYPEMVSFANNYGFTWQAHALGHANRKAGKERNFWTVETNFLPGRTFTTLENLNAQGIEWATDRFARRPQAKTRLIPIELFEAEKSALVPLPDFVSAPCLPHERLVDEYGYASFDGNFYWVPETVTKKTVTVLQYAHHLRIMDGLKEVAHYDIAAEGIKNEMIVPPGHTSQPRGVPHNRKRGCDQEEKRLLELGEIAATYLADVKDSHNGVRQQPAFIRGLYALLKRLGPTLLTQSLQRAQAYQVYDLAVIERIASQIVETDHKPAEDADIDISEEYKKRSAYQAGAFSEENPICFEQNS